MSLTTKITSTTYCDDPKCPGEVTVLEVAGRIVLTNDPTMPLAVVTDDEGES